MSEDIDDDGDLSDLLAELRILLPGAQLLTAFLITLPFSAGFARLVQLERWAFMATFLFSLASLILFTAPAVQHRLMRPLRDRTEFKRLSTRQMVVGSVSLSFALVIGSALVISEVFGHQLGAAVGTVVSVFIAALWWILPKRLKMREPS